MMEKSSDDVSNIHNRYSLTLINPASHYFSLIVSLLVASIITATIHLAYLGTDQILYRIPIVIVVLVLLQKIDSGFILRKEYSKSLHASLFGNLIWVLTLLSGLASSVILSKEVSTFFIVEGMFLFASFRIGIFTTTLGTSIKKAWAICFVQPVVMLLVILPQSMIIDIVNNQLAFIYGVVFLGIATAWSMLTDRAGRPSIDSTHKTIQAYLASQRDDLSELEKLIEVRSNNRKVSTSQIKLSSTNNSAQFRVVIPEIHPGPYHPVGGSNIPYLIYKNLNSSAMVMHSISDHSLNLPTRNEVQNYLTRLETSTIKEEGLVCTEPVTVQINKSRAIGLLFGNNALLFLSLSPHGMEDLPVHIKTEIEQYAKNRNFNRVLIVDCHNAMGEEISKDNAEDMLKAAKSCLDTLIGKESYPIEFGYSNSEDMNLNAPDLGMGGLGVVCLKINGEKYFLGWSDSNNMENGVREKIVENFAKNEYKLLEVCTSDTHFARVKARNRNGYYQLGLVTSPDELSKWFLKIAKRAEENMASAKFEILESEADVKVMGPQIFEDFSKALDNSLKITKVFMIASVGLFISSLFL